MDTNLRPLVSCRLYTTIILMKPNVEDKHPYY